MKRGVMQSSSVQQMMATGNPSLWNINNFMSPPFLSSSSSSSTTHFLAPPSNYSNYYHHNHPFYAQLDINNIISTPSSSWLDHDHPNNNHHEQPPHQLPESWSQLLLGGVLMGEEEKKMEGWEEQAVFQHHHPSAVDMKQERSVNSYSNSNKNNNHHHHNSNVHSHEQQDLQVAAAKATNWSPQMNITASSPQSCVTTTFSSNNILDFSSKSSDNCNLHPRHHPLPVPDHSSECNSPETGGALKKSKIQPSSIQSTFKVRKEKLGDRVTALHQLVSPFGKTDTASVLLEAIGYIRFLQSQIEALSLPYLSNGAGNKRQPHNVQQGEKKCIFPEDPGQLLDENCLKRKGGPDDQDSCEEAKDLRSRGLCLVPLSCTMHVGSDNGADYWAPTTLGGGFR